VSTGACEVMRTNVVVLPWDGTLEKAYRLIYSKDNPKGQHLFPVLGPDGDLKGVVTRNQLVQLHQRAELESQSVRLEEIATKNPRVAYSDEPLRRVVERMADSGFTRFPVLDPAGNGNIVGMVALSDLLRARTKNLEDERARERVLRIRMPFGRGPNERKVPLTKETNFARGIDGLVAGRSVAADRPVTAFKPDKKMRA
jgi:CIC family chloride channel protein